MRKRRQLLKIIKHLSWRHCHCPKSRGESEWWKVRGYVSSPGHLNGMTTLWVASSSPFYNWESWDSEWPTDFQGISPQVTKPGRKPSNYDSRFCCLPLSRVARESEALGELLAYLLYTFLMNRPLGLIKGKKKRLIIFPNSCKLFTFHLCWWLIKEQTSMGTTQSGYNSSRVHNEVLVWRPTCEQGWARCHIQTCSRQRGSLPWAWFNLQR